MAFLQELQQHIGDYLFGRTDIAAVREWLAPLVVDNELCEDPQAKRLVYAMQRSVSDLAEGFLSEDDLRKNFAALLAPFLSLSVFQIAPAWEVVPTVVSSAGPLNLVEGSELVAAGVGPALVFA